METKRQAVEKQAGRQKSYKLTQKAKQQSHFAVARLSLRPNVPFREITPKYPVNICFIVHLLGHNVKQTGTGKRMLWLRQKQNLAILLGTKNIFISVFFGLSLYYAKEALKKTENGGGRPETGRNFYRRRVPRQPRTGRLGRDFALPRPRKRNQRGRARHHQQPHGADRCD